MDDQAWAELEAETFTASGQPEPAGSPSGDDPALSLQDDSSVPDTAAEQPVAEEEPSDDGAADPDADTPTEAEAVDDVVHERILELERALAERDAKDAEKQAQIAAKLQQFQDAQRLKEEQAEAEATAGYVQQLREQGDNDLADAIVQGRNWLVQSRRQALDEAEGHLRGLEALTMVLEDHLSEDQIRAIIKDAYEIAPLPSHQKQQWLSTRRQSKVQATEREMALMQQVQELQNRLAARERPIAADIVEGGRTGGGGSLRQQLDEAADFNDWFATFERAGAA